jgi:hypothetical protein
LQSVAWRGGEHVGEVIFLGHDDDVIRHGVPDWAVPRRVEAVFVRRVKTYPVCTRVHKAERACLTALVSFA